MSSKKITRVGVDIAKSIFHVHGVNRHGETDWTAKLRRNNWINAIIKRVQPGAQIAMEACATSNHWGRTLQVEGFDVKLIAALFVKPYVKSNKNDRADAEAICEAASRPGMRFVAVKTVQQQDVQAVHRVRDELIKHRTARANQIRGLVAEYGLVAPAGIGQLRQALPQWLEDADNGLSSSFRSLLSELAEDLHALDQRIECQNQRIAQAVGDDEACRRLLEIRGVGPIVASALRCQLGDGREFKKGRDFAASLGLVPPQHSTGGKERLLGISKRGDCYTRKVLVHGARSVIRHSNNRDDDLGLWIRRMCERMHVNIVTVALANKMARVAWALLNNESRYDPTLAAG